MLRKLAQGTFNEEIRSTISVANFTFLNGDMYLSLPSRLFKETKETMLRQAQKVFGDSKGRDLDQLQAQQRAKKKKNQNNSSW